MALWFWLIAWILTISTVFGNGFVIYLIVTRYKLRTLANRFVLSLAVADFMFGASFCPSLFVCDVLAPCITIYRIATISLLALISNTNLCTMILDRYMAVVKPLMYAAYMTPRRIRVLICAAWGAPTIAFLVCLITGVFIRAQTDRTTEKSFYLFLSYVEIIPCVVLLIVTARVLLIARQHGNQMAVLASQLCFNDENRRTKRPKKMPIQTLVKSSARVVVVTVVVFVICYSIDIYFTSCTEFELCQPSEILKCVLRLLLITNSAINPLAYAFFKKDIQREIRSIFYRWKVKFVKTNEARIHKGACPLVSYRCGDR